MAKQNFTFMSRNPPPEPVASVGDLEFRDDGSLAVVDDGTDMSEAEDVDQFSEELGPVEIRDIPTFPAALYYEFGGTRLREFAVDSITLPGNWAEFGVSYGLSGYYWMMNLPDDAQLFLFDSWEGLPEQWVMEREDKTTGYIPKGAFRGQPPVFHDERVHTVKGWFEDTLPKEDMGELAFVHMDCDLYSSTKLVLERCDAQIVPGTIILFDELWGYQCWREGEYQALMEWQREWKYLARDNKHRVVVEVLK